MRLMVQAHLTHVNAVIRATLEATKNVTLLLFSVAVLLSGGAAAVRGQSALDGFDPNANAVVRVVVVQPDGKILLGGDFTTLSPNGGVAVTRNHIARLNPNGTLDTAFDPNADGVVNAIAVQTDGKVLAGGSFSNIGGGMRNRIARLDANTGLADSFDPNANAQVSSIAVQTDGKILVGGSFNGPNSIGGQMRNSIARLDAATGLADSFNPNASNAVKAIVVQPDGQILVGGTFGNIGGQTRNFIARLDANSGLADSFNPNANEMVNTIAVQADGRVLVGGDFVGPNSIGGQARNYLARLDANSGLADSFNPNANDTVNTIAVQADGKILAGGFFFTIGGQTRNFLARLFPTTGLADSFAPNANGFVSSIVVEPNGKILVGGSFSGANSIGGAGLTRNFIARLESDGRLDLTLNLSMVGSFVFAIVIQPDGKILIGGDFNTVLGVTRNNIARLNADGTLDMTFNPNADNQVLSIAVQPNDGKIVVGGAFFNIGGQPRTRIARLDATTGLADSFDPGTNNNVHAIAVQTDGKILVGGNFTMIGGQSRRLARFNTDDTLEMGFNPNPNDSVFTITVQTNGQILVGGFFSGANSIGGQTRNFIARLDATTGLADSFDPNSFGYVTSIAVQPDGKVIVGGGFNAIGGQTRFRIARVDGTTGLADMFNPIANNDVYAIAVQADGKILISGFFTTLGPNGGAVVPRHRIARLNPDGTLDGFDPDADNGVHAIAVQADGKILAGGGFTSIGGQPRNQFARLNNDIAALQNLDVTKTTITWTRGGSSPQFTRVTFEYSLDNANYSSLGNGTPTGSSWTRTGLSLSTGQNIYIRARGYYRSGQINGSESIIELVRNAFIAGPTAAGATISGRITTSDGTPVAGVVVTLSGAQSVRTITNSSGNYHFADLETNEFYTVAPQLANYSLSPTNRFFFLIGNQTEAVFTATPDAFVVGNAIDTPEFFVRQHYLDFLGREPDQGGFRYWSDQVNQCHADADCSRARRIDVSVAFFKSPEFQETGAFIYRLYKGALGRQPRYDEFSADHPQVVGGPNVEASKTAFADRFAQRQEFARKYETNTTGESFVDALLQTISDAGADLSRERDSLIGRYRSGQTINESRSLVVRALADNAPFSNAVYNESFVLMEYFGYLKRNPDPRGYAFWLNVLNTGNPGNYRGMVCAFITSTEYQRRFSVVVNHSNAECGP